LTIKNFILLISIDSSMLNIFDNTRRGQSFVNTCDKIVNFFK
jgi:hypothetical protein